MATLRVLQQYIENLEVGLAARLDDVVARLDAIDNELAIIRSLRGGQAFIDPQFVAERLGLTSTQSRVAVALAEGKTVHDIAEARGRSKATVRWHLREINRKLGVSTQAQVVRAVLLLPPGSTGS